MMNPEVVAIIVNFNSVADVLNRLDELRRFSIPSIVVDHSPELSESTRLRMCASPTVEYVPAPENRGYGAGMNLGLQLAYEVGYDLAWLINPDSIVSEEAFNSLLSKFDEGVGLIVPRQVSGSVSPYQTYSSAAVWSNGRYRTLLCEGCESGKHEVDVATGTGLLLNIRASREAGDFREDFFHYKEEFELAVRLRSLSNRIILDCRATVWHQRGGSLAQESPSARYYRFRNEFIFYRVVGCYSFWRALKIAMWALRQDHFRFSRPFREGVGDGLLDRRGRR